MPQPLGDLSLTASIGGVASVTLSATIDPITANISVRKARGDLAWPWWFQQYVRRIEAEREAERLAWLAAHTITGDGWACVEMPVGSGTAYHNPDEGLEELVAAWLVRRAA